MAIDFNVSRPNRRNFSNSGFESSQTIVDMEILGGYLDDGDDSMDGSHSRHETGRQGTALELPYSRFLSDWGLKPLLNFPVNLVDTVHWLKKTSDFLKRIAPVRVEQIRQNV